MSSAEGGSPSGRGEQSIYSLSASDPAAELVDRAGLTESDIAQIDALMGAMSRWRSAEKALRDASQEYMALGETDMRALHHLIVCENTGVLATPGLIAQHLGISSASTTKLLDRLEDAGHVRRSRHPSDRRALVIAITPATRAAALRTLGAMHARKAIVAQRLSPAEREVVTGFLDDLADELSLADIDWAQPPPD
ncbi:MarR family winged helix-turn-helix transcriptional regulator [Brachybacterium sp. YJGR34]|uniref:MarR family winged helix-turn-helix transcriptional regulator n=1 Tax=Brachybacterium sp. YJGR34 TaxID=2059911 RepID=UPI000E0A3CB1|nr:MarR family transcriptional regulator [Brachybacterium sp. YJGR34]